jgi:hypothetical protein
MSGWMDIVVSDDKWFGVMRSSMFNSDGICLQRYLLR